MAVEIINSGKQIRFDVIDHFRGSDEAAHRDDPDVAAGTLRQAFDRNTAPVAHMIDVWQDDSAEIAFAFEDASIDFVFVDAGHDYESVKADILAWLPKLKPGGVIAGDDIDWPGVHQAVSEIFGASFWPRGRQWIVAKTPSTRAAFLGFRGLFIASPIFSAADPEFMRSVMVASHALRDAGFGHEYQELYGDSLIGRCRNSLVAKFMASPCSHMLFIDADIGFAPSDILRLLRSDKDVVAGIYPKKTYPIEFPVRVKPEAKFCLISGCLEIESAPTGFLMIRREVISRMMQAYPDLHYVKTSTLNDKEDRFAFDFFECVLQDRGDGSRRKLSEDYGFCERWRAIGGDVWCDPEIRLTHYGRHGFTKSLADHLRELEAK